MENKKCPVCNASPCKCNDHKDHDHKHEKMHGDSHKCDC
jgi:hypothetical protein